MRLVISLLLFAIIATIIHPAIAAARAEQSATLTGTVTNGSVPVANAVVELENTGGTRTTKTSATGAFSLPNVPNGTYHLSIRGDGYLATRIDVTVAGTMAPLEIRLNADPHFSEVISVSPDARSQFDSYQPTTVLGGQELASKLQPTLGATLANEPGVSVRGFGPGPARPVIRGLDGDRVLVLEDGNRMGDLSSQSGDHGVNVNPAAADKIEVVRGPATLLYGANAIGGLVNVVTRSIPTTRVATPTGTATMDLASAASEAGGAGDITAGHGPIAVHFSASGRRAGDYTSPGGDVPNSFNRGGFVEGGLSFIRDNGYVGASVGYDRTHYGIPFVEEGETNLNPRRRLFDVRAEQRNLSGPITSVRVSLGVRRYTHNELDGEEIATTFVNDANEIEALATLRQVGRLKSTIGGQVPTRDFSASGEEALSPEVNQKGGAVFAYEEAAITPHATLQFGGRVDHARFNPAEDLTARSFTNVSGSVGLLTHPTDSTTITVSLASASRNPALEELYFHGPHAGNNAVENGDDSLVSEHALGVDASFRWQHPRASGEVTVFANRIRNFIFRELTGEIDEDGGLPITFFTQGDATLSGFESHVDLRLTRDVWLEGGLDYVRGQLTSLDVPLPRMPPMRGRIGVRYQRNAFQAGIDGTFSAAQDRIFTVESDNGPVGETTTDGYNLAKLYAAYTFAEGRTTHTLAARLENAGNVRYQNHLNYLKDLAPEAGRDFRVTYTVGF